MAMADRTLSFGGLREEDKGGGRGGGGIGWRDGGDEGRVRGQCWGRKWGGGWCGLDLWRWRRRAGSVFVCLPPLGRSRKILGIERMARRDVWVAWESPERWAVRKAAQRVEGVFGDGGPRLLVAPVGGNGEGGGWGVVEVGCRGECR